MAELLLVNPSKRRKRKSARRRKGRMPAALRAYWAKHGRGGGRRRRRKAHATHAKRRRKSNPSYRHHARRRRRSNPSLRGITGRMVPTLKRGFTGAVGGLMNDLIMGQVLPASWLPTMLASGMGATATKILGALIVGTIGGYAWRGKGQDLGDGAMTVVLHDALKAQLQTMLPASVPLGEYLTFAPTVGYTGGGATPQLSGLGEYIGADIGNPDPYGQYSASGPGGQMGLYLTS